MTTTMDAWDAASWSEYNTALIDDLRAHQGTATVGRFAGRELLLLITTGAKSGQTRTAPLAFRVSA